MGRPFIFGKNFSLKTHRKGAEVTEIFWFTSSVMNECVK